MRRVYNGVWMVIDIPSRLIKGTGKALGPQLRWNYWNSAGVNRVSNYTKIGSGVQRTDQVEFGSCDDDGQRYWLGGELISNTENRLGITKRKKEREAFVRQRERTGARGGVPDERMLCDGELKGVNFTGLGSCCSHQWRRHETWSETARKDRERGAEEMEKEKEGGEREKTYKHTNIHRKKRRRQTHIRGEGGLVKDKNIQMSDGQKNKEKGQ